jgi:[glutamine synthetase] adenylyltransferase / [glutamine synthetase]-adenylyl-L-tyrosine phosphorylase
VAKVQLRPVIVTSIVKVLEQAAESARALKADGSLSALSLASNFALDWLQVHRDWIDDIHAPPALDPNQSQDARSICIYRGRRSLAQIYLECTGQLSIEESLAFASDTAIHCIRAALQQAEREIETRFGLARDADQQVVRLVIFGMGKLGGHELNFSSDIDLIMGYAAAGESDGARSLENAEYFARITRRTAQLLSERCELGSAYRVDLRLRPFGSAGQAALSFAAMEDYYQREGRDWERYAWIKARPIAGDLAAGLKLCEWLRPFVYRRYLDFAAFEGMREMKALVDAEVRKADRLANLKLGPGGIREIEFLIQLEQLIRGGRDASLRVSGSLPALSALCKAGWLSTVEHDSLRADYLFLRAVENRVQMIGDQQTHDLPEAPELQLRIAASMNFDSLTSFQDQLNATRLRVHQRFNQAIQKPTDASQPQFALLETDDETSSSSMLGLGKTNSITASIGAANDQAQDMWAKLTGPDREQINASDKPAEISELLWQALIGFADSQAVQNASNRGRTRIDKVVPMLWAMALKLKAEQIEPTALRLIEFLQAIATRSAYVALLAEKPQVAERLVQLFAESAWLARLMTSTPMLLDELLDQRRLLVANDPASLANELTRELHAQDGSTNAHSAHLDDLEHAFEILLAFQHSVQMRAAVGFLQGRIAALEVVQILSDLADQMIAKVLSFAWIELTRQHGLPEHCAKLGDGFAIIGYGSLGGKELNFASDLDLVFVYDHELAAGETRGHKAIDAQRFYVKLAQRVIFLLTTPTRFGALYAIDTRLRPNGNKGLLVTSLQAYGEYQSHEAWLWEHQALVRARGITGQAELLQAFETLRHSVLNHQRDATAVRIEVDKMRERMRAELDRTDAYRFDLKQGRTGLVDLEFQLQAAILSVANAHAAWPTETHALLTQLMPEKTKQHQRLLHLGLKATLQLRPRLIARAEMDSTSA